MKVTVVERHLGEGVFPLFKRGCSVKILEDCNFYVNWKKCLINNIITYIPKHFIKAEVLLVDYNPTELICDVNDEIEVIDIVYGWIYGKINDEIGWVPCYKIFSNNNFKY